MTQERLTKEAVFAKNLERVFREAADWKVTHPLKGGPRTEEPTTKEEDVRLRPPTGGPGKKSPEKGPYGKKDGP